MENDKSRAPLSLVTVLDRSGSMEGEKMVVLKKAAEFIAVTVQEGDSVGVVSYSDDVSTSYMNALANFLRSKFLGECWCRPL